jgi:hypothetical protein
MWRNFAANPRLNLFHMETEHRSSKHLQRMELHWMVKFQIKNAWVRTPLEAQCAHCMREASAGRGYPQPTRAASSVDRNPDLRPCGFWVELYDGKPGR